MKHVHFRSRSPSPAAVDLVLVSRYPFAVRSRLFIPLLIIGVTAFAASPLAKPQDVSIVDVPAERRDYATHIGNIKVWFTDGHTEMWTEDGRCLIPHTSSAGYVGWTRYTSRNSYGEPFNNLLRVRFPDGTHHDFRVGVFIEDW